MGREEGGGFRMGNTCIPVCIGEGNGNPLQCSSLENPREGGSLVGCRLWGCTELDTTEVT